MRYIAVFLLLANLGYLAWSLTRDPTPAAGSGAVRPLLNTGISLVSEFQAQTQQQQRQDADSERQCSLVVGFDGSDEANSFISSARAAGFEAALRLTGAPLPAQYRVYLAPASSRAIAAITLDGLSERLVETELEVETYLITRGLLENAIALGVFNAEGNAVRVRNLVRELGYEARIEEIPRSDGDTQVLLRPVDSERVEESEWLDLSAERPALSRSENLCQTIAQASQFP